MNWQLYIVLCSDNSLYTGITTDIERRLLQHTNGTGAKYFRGRQPSKVIYQETGHTRSSASKRELEIKALTHAEKLILTSRIYRLLAADGATYESPVPGQFGGYRPLGIYGRLDCWSARKFLVKGGYAKGRVFFADEQTAIAAGFRPCGHCLRPQYKIWKCGGVLGTQEYPWLVTPKHS